LIAENIVVAMALLSVINSTSDISQLPIGLR
jgi:hypothetical protein